MTVKLDVREAAAQLPDEAGDDIDIMDKEIGEPCSPAQELAKD